MPGIDSTRRILSGTIAGLSGLCVAVAGVRLITSLPWGNYVARFWDCAALIQGIQNDGFVTGNSAVVAEYGILKYGYALPFWVLYRVIGTDAAMAWGIFWFLIMLVAPAMTPLFRGNRGFGWPGYLAYAAALTALPFTHKYISMANPTIQSMALWMLLALFYDAGGRLHRLLSQSRIIPGVMCGLLVVTDYKWAPFCVAVVLALETFEARQSWVNGWKHNLPTAFVSVIDRFILTLMWMSAVVGLVALTNNLYLRSVTGYVSGPLKIEAFRFDLSWNFPIFLWVLGGLWFVIWALHEPILARVKSQPENTSPATPIATRLLVVAATVILGFSLVFWPRAARMFAPAATILFCLAGWRVHEFVQKIDRSGQVPKLAFASLILVLLGLQVRAFDAGECNRLPAGVDQVAEHVKNHSHDIAVGPVGCYDTPIFSLAAGDSVRWVRLLVASPQSMNLIVTSDHLDQVIVDDQELASIRPRGLGVATARLQRQLRERSTVISSFPNDFYASPYYLCETDYADGGLLAALRRGAEVAQPQWDIRRMDHEMAPVAGVGKDASR